MDQETDHIRIDPGITDPFSYAGGAPVMNVTSSPPPMHRRQVLASGLSVGLGALAGCTGNGDDATDSEPTEDDDQPAAPSGYTTEVVADGLTHPWAIAFLPEEPYLLVTERDADLQLVSSEDGSTQVVSGTPDVFTGGQGGLLDLALHPEYPESKWVYLTYAIADGDFYTTTALGRGELDRSVPELQNFEVLHEVDPWIQSNGHFGSRVIVGPDEHLYMTVGDRQEKDFGPDHVSQDTSNEIGTTLRLTLDGAIPSDNPFLEEERVVDSIYSYGHRNAQGMTVHPETEEIWQTEHGEQDGDEINVITAGGNYGWPLATYGCTYGGGNQIGEEPDTVDDVVEPVYYWECNSSGFPPAGATFYDGEAFPDWKGDLFVGTLAEQYLGHFSVDGHDVEELDPLLSDHDWRIRDVTVEPGTGYPYIAVDAEDAPIVRIVPDE